jgi:signal transduction histidine kinase
MKFDVYKNNIIKAKSIGAKIRLATEITKDNINHCKELTEIVDEVRHLDGLKGSIVVSESEFISTTTWKESQLLNPIIYSKEKEFVEQQQYIFDILWKKALPFAQKVLEIEKGTVPEVIETISNFKDILSKTFEFLDSANNEILLLLSTTNAFHRLADAGAFQKLKEIRDKKPGATIRILTPNDTEIEKTGADLSNNLNCKIRFIDPLSRISILIIDQKYSLVAETKDDSKRIVAEAIGFVTYSTSLPTVLSYAAIFGSLWKQTEVLEELKKAHENLLVHDKIQKDFINTAAHELRTPIQPILGLSEWIKNKTNDKELNGLLLVISRNAQRLKKLSEDILEVSKIESNLLNPNKEYFKINELIVDTIDCFKNNGDIKNIKFQYPPDDEKLVVYCDKNDIRLVISNLISNSIKFTHAGGTVSIRTDRKINSHDSKIRNGREAVVVTIKDNGIGIDKEIMPKLFTKFASKSFQGMGLGLYISKSIIEAHGGRIWAENSKNGSIFSFSLPLYNSK